MYFVIFIAWVIAVSIILQILGGNRQLERKLNKKKSNKENF
tara:strand:- start:4127 stop:4249 length:123 start_codon:yes stop_codon:yes gene_type:complete